MKYKKIKVNNSDAKPYLRFALNVPTGTLCTRFLFCTPTGDMKILIYELLNKYTVIEDHRCGHIYIICFPTKL